MTVLVTGARGAIARSLLALLRGDGTDVRAASRSPRDLPGSVRCALTEPTTFAAALSGVTSVFLYAEPAHIDAFLTEAARAGVRHIVLLSSNSVLEGATTNTLAREHLTVERAVAAGPVGATILRPSAFARNALQWSWSIAGTGAVRLPYPNAHIAPIHEDDIASVAHAVLADPPLGGSAHTLTGPESFTFADQLDQLGRAIGRPVGAIAVSRDEWKAEMAGYIPGHYADSLLDIWQSADGTPVEVTKDVEELTGRPARTFASWAEENVAAFRPASSGGGIHR